jgi:hypothetical protein
VINSVLRTVLNLIVAVSLVASPHAVVLGAVDTGKDVVTHSETIESCHCHPGHGQATTGARKMAAMQGACTCCDGDCKCPDYKGCHHPHTATLFAIPSGSPGSHASSDDAFENAEQDVCNGLNPSPGLHPPIA